MILEQICVFLAVMLAYFLLFFVLGAKKRAYVLAVLNSTSGFAAYLIYCTAVSVPFETLGSLLSSAVGVAGAAAYFIFIKR